MSKSKVGYNERAWGVDLISYIDRFSQSRDRPIKGASGEHTISGRSNRLFPDVLLFGDRSKGLILQGWELKFPDTQISDTEFRQNAEEKADRLGLDSFLLWNVTRADLYARDGVRGGFNRTKSWDDLADIKDRKSVDGNRRRWQSLARDIIEYLNDLFDEGELVGRDFVDAFRDGDITSLLLENSGIVADALERFSRTNRKFRNELVIWWSRHKKEYIGDDQYEVLAQAILTNWTAKFLFAHVLRKERSQANSITKIKHGTNVKKALEIFLQISEKCDFWSIFSPILGSQVMPKIAWNQMKQFHSLLNDVKLGSIDQRQIADLLETTTEVTRRKLRGQYPTPVGLARLLVHLCIQDFDRDKVLDPCCGSGTIIRAAFDLKYDAEVTKSGISDQIFASDLDPQAVQLTTFALAKPEMINLPIRVFQQDVFDLARNTRVEFRDPMTGKPMVEKLGRFDAIVTNLPFVDQFGRDYYRDGIKKVNATLSEKGDPLPENSDIAAYIPFSICPLLKKNGRMGIVITNAWLGTKWGRAFQQNLSNYYDIKYVITSGVERWFRASEVVANMIILEKRTKSAKRDNVTKYVVLNRPLDELLDDETARTVAAQIETGKAPNKSLTIRRLEKRKIRRFQTYGMGGNAQFVDCDWLFKLPLVPITTLFHVFRGERRGMNELFYPSVENEIEEEYLHPLAKTIKDFDGLIDSPKQLAFSCMRSIKELRSLGHAGAIKWIRRFESESNIDKLKRANLDWYQMDASRKSELVMGMAYDKRIFIPRLNPRSFLDQRLIGLQERNDEIDLDLCHALLNSAVSIFLVEGLGFGRGLSVLDLNKDTVEQYLHVLDPSKLSRAQITEIKRKFESLQKRRVSADILGDLSKTDRRAFDEAVLEAYGNPVSRKEIYRTLRSLIRVRRAASKSD